MAKLLTSAQMRAVEADAIASGAVTGLELMERAGQGVVAAILAAWPGLAAGPAAGLAAGRAAGLAASRAIVLCGPGNNGGDGYVVARLLAALGWEVFVLATTAPERLPPDATANARRWQAAGGRIGDYGAPGLGKLSLGHLLCDSDRDTVLIDALLGIGQDRRCDALLAPLNAALDHRSTVAPRTALHVVAVDLPTGYDADTGALLADAPVEPDLTVTFHAEKPVHQILRSGGYAVVVKDIGLAAGIDPAPGPIPSVQPPEAP